MQQRFQNNTHQYALALKKMPGDANDKAMQTLRNIGIIGRITLIEGARRQVFHVLLFFALALILGAVALARFDGQVQRKMLTDLGMCAIFLVSSLIAVTVSVGSLPGEVEQRTITPVIAKPVLRWQFLFGKYAGAMATVAVGMAAMTGAFAGLEACYVGHVDVALFVVVPFLFLEAAVLGAIALWLSTFTSWPLAWFLSLLVCLLGNVRTPLYDHLTAQLQSLFDKAAISALYGLLPDLASFDLKDALVHHLTLSGGLLAQTAMYAVCYIWAVLGLAAYSFARREL